MRVYSIGYVCEIGPVWYTISILIDICRCLAGWQLDRYRSIFSAVATFAAQIQPRFSQIWESYGDLSPVRRFYYENFSFCYEIKKLPQSTCIFTMRIWAIFSIFQFLLWKFTRNWRYMWFSANICQYLASGGATTNIGSIFSPVAANIWYRSSLPFIINHAVPTAAPIAHHRMSQNMGKVQY